MCFRSVIIFFSQRIEALSSLKPEAPNASSIRKNQFPIQCYFQQHPFNRSSMCTISMPEIYLAPGLHYTSRVPSPATDATDGLVCVYIVDDCVHLPRDQSSHFYRQQNITSNNTAK